MCALAGRLGEGREAWRHVIPLPFELAALPHQLFAALRLPVVSYALPALIASGEHVDPAPVPAPAGLTEEALELLGWLDTPEVRLVRTSGGLALPRLCGGDLVQRLGEVRRSTHQGWHEGHDHRAIAGASRPTGPVDAVPVTRMISA